MRTHAKNILANLYIKFGLVLILLATFAVVYLIVTNTEIDTQTQAYNTYNSAGRYIGSGARTERQGETLVVGAVAIGIGFVAALFSLLSRKYVVDFEKNYVPMRGASHERKRLLLLSALLGYTGLDRILTKRYGLGTCKFLLFALNAAMVYSWISGYTHGFVLPTAVIGMIGFLAALLVYWWTVDIMMLVLGAYRKQGRELLR